MSLFTDLIALKNAIAAEPKDWMAILNAFLKVVDDLRSGTPLISFGAADGEGTTDDVKGAIDDVVSACQANLPVGAAGDEVGKIGDGTILKIIMAVLPLILKFL